MINKVFLVPSETSKADKLVNEYLPFTRIDSMSKANPKGTDRTGLHGKHFVKARILNQFRRYIKHCNTPTKKINKLIKKWRNMSTVSLGNNMISSAIWF